MKWVVATIGAIIVMGGAFLAVLLLPVAVYPAIYTSTIGLLVMYLLGLTLAICAGVMSFRATLRQYEPKSPAEVKPRTP
jgi:hypothetical protein